jgi:hypothetical protein
MSEPVEDKDYSTEPDSLLPSAYEFHKERMQYHKNRLWHKPTDILTLGTVFAVLTGALFKTYRKPAQEL